MRTRICEMFGIKFPIFAFSHCRIVVVAVSKAEEVVPVPFAQPGRRLR